MASAGGRGFFISQETAMAKQLENETDLFDGAEPAEVTIPLLAEELSDAHKLIAEEGWDEPEGLHIILSNGLAYLLGPARLERHKNTGGDSQGEIERLTHELMDMQAKYAVMKFRAFMLQDARDALQMHVTGLKGENEMSASRLWKFRADEERLKTELTATNHEIESLRRELAVLRGEAPPPPEPPKGIFARLRGLLGR
jgi:hypothetical protein